MWTTCERHRVASGLIIHLGFPTQYALTSTFMRLQEFYESPISTIRNCCFTLEQFMDAYAEQHGGFTYTSDWNGFNVPGHAVREFFGTFEHGLLDKERDLRDVIGRILYSPDKFYLIGTQNGSDVAYHHEIAHAHYYLDDDYRERMNQFLKTVPAWAREKLHDWFHNLGYSPAVFEDELHAYLATDSLDDMIENWGTDDGHRMFEVAASFRQHFDETVAKFLDPKV